MRHIGKSSMRPIWRGLFADEKIAPARDARRDYCRNQVVQSG
jgi:hypothetical protein